jgi:hypothetical protein
MLKPVKVEITTDDGIIRVWTGDDAVKWSAFMARNYGASLMPHPTIVINPENAPTYQKAKAQKRKGQGVG